MHNFIYKLEAVTKNYKHNSCHVFRKYLPSKPGILILICFSKTPFWCPCSNTLTHGTRKTSSEKVWQEYDQVAKLRVVRLLFSLWFTRELLTVSWHVGFTNLLYNGLDANISYVHLWCINWYTFINKTSMSETCLYNISYQKATRFLQQPVATEGIWLQFGTALTLLQYTVEWQ